MVKYELTIQVVKCKWSFNPFEIIMTIVIFITIHTHCWQSYIRYAHLRFNRWSGSQVQCYVFRYTSGLMKRFFLCLVFISLKKKKNTKIIPHFSFVRQNTLQQKEEKDGCILHMLFHVVLILTIYRPWWWGTSSNLKHIQPVCAPLCSTTHFKCL